MEEAGQRYAPSRTLDVSVDSVRFVSEDEAEVHFTLWLSQFGAQGLNHTGTPCAWAMSGRCHATPGAGWCA
jgi:hypothetical protein